MAKKQKTRKIETIYLILLFGIIIGLVWFWFIFMDLDERITEIECGIGLKGCSTAPAILSQPNPLEGWTEECTEYKTIEKYKFIQPDENCNQVCVSEESCARNLYPEIWGLHTKEKYDTAIKDSMCITQDRCYDLCNEEFVTKKPYIDFWNESICIKKILVKDERP